MTIINLRGLVTLLGGSAPLTAGVVRATYWDANGPHINVAGEEVTFPRTFEVPILAGIPLDTIELQPTDGRYGVAWQVVDEVLGHRLDRFTAIPDVDEVAFGELVDVDPKTLQPTTTAVAAWTAAIAEITAMRDEIRARSFAATPDPEDPGVLLIDYPSTMAHPDGSSIVIPISEV